MADWIIATCAVGAFAISMWNTWRIRELHVVVNSRLTELLQVTALAARAEGHLQGVVDSATDIRK